MRSVTITWTLPTWIGWRKRESSIPSVTSQRRRVLCQVLAGRGKEICHRVEPVAVETCSQPPVAVGHRLLLIIYNVLRFGQTYQERPSTALDQYRRRRVRDRALDQLRQLGYDVTVTASLGIVAHRNAAFPFLDFKRDRRPFGSDDLAE